MRGSVFSIIGVALLAGGAYVLLEGGYISSRKQVVKVGGMEISAEQRHPVEPWMAGAALVAGTVLVLVGVTRKS